MGDRRSSRFDNGCWFYFSLSLPFSDTKSWKQEMALIKHNVMRRCRALMTKAPYCHRRSLLSQSHNWCGLGLSSFLLLGQARHAIFIPMHYLRFFLCVCVCVCSTTFLTIEKSQRSRKSLNNETNPLRFLAFFPTDATAFIITADIFIKQYIHTTQRMRFIVSKMDTRHERTFCM